MGGTKVRIIFLGVRRFLLRRSEGIKEVKTLPSILSSLKDAFVFTLFTPLTLSLLKEAFVFVLFYSSHSFTPKKPPSPKKIVLLQMKKKKIGR